MAAGEGTGSICQAPHLGFSTPADIVFTVVLPLLLIIAAIVSSGVVAYGTHPGWMSHAHGLDIILWSRRLEWPLVSVAIIACVLLIGLAISGRRRAWWLVGLAPVLALLAHRFGPGPASERTAVVDNPAFVTAAAANIHDDDWVVGLTFGDGHFAYPYSALFATPVVIQSDHDKRLILIWSAYANRALAFPIDRELKARDLEIVSTPANALLLYNSRRGQFINGLTGHTVRDEKPNGFSSAGPILTVKMTWKSFQTLHPDAQVLAGASDPHAPTRPIKPTWPMPPMSLDHPADLRIAVVGTHQPVAVDSAQLTEAPLNSKADDTPIALFRPQPDLPALAYDRRTFEHNKLDLIVELKPNPSAKRHPHALFIDDGSNSGWNAAGLCVDAPNDAKYLKGKKLQPVMVDTDLSWGVMKYWYPDLQLQTPPAAPAAVEESAETGPVSNPRHHSSHRPQPAH